MWFVNCLKDMTVKMSWEQFIPSLIATFVGIFVPFWIQSRIQKRQRRNDAVDKILQVYEELTSLKGKIKEQLSITRLETPIGDGLMNADEMSLLADLQRYVRRKYRRKSEQEEYIFASEDWYKMIFDVYAQVSNYNIMQEKYAEQTFYVRNHFIVNLNDEQLQKTDPADKKIYQEALRTQTVIEKTKHIQATKVLITIKDSRSKIVNALVGKEGSIDRLLGILDKMLAQFNKNPVNVETTQMGVK